MASPILQTSAYQPFILCGHNAAGYGISRDYRDPGWYALWVLQSGSATLEEPSGRVLKLSAPTAVLQPPRGGYTFRTPQAAQCRLIEFDVAYQPRKQHPDRGDWEHKGPSRQPNPEDVWGLSLAVLVPPLYQRGAESTAVFCGDQWWRGPLSHARANARLAEWLACYAGQQETDPVESSDGSDWAATCCRVAWQYLYQGLTVRRWAKLMGLSRQHFSQRFKESMGQAPRVHLDNCRLERARRLLLIEGMTVGEVAWQCGFRSLSSFSRFFSRTMGQSPRQWQRGFSRVTSGSGSPSNSETPPTEATK